MLEPKPKIALFFHPKYAYSREEQSELAEILGEYFDVEYKSDTLLLSPEIFISIGLGVLAGTATIALQALIGKITEDLYEASKRFLNKREPKPQTWKFNFEIDGVSFTGQIKAQSSQKISKAFKNLLHLFQFAEQVTLDRKLPDGMTIEEIRKDLSTPKRVLTSEDNLEKLRWVTFNYDTVKEIWEIVSVGYADGYFVTPDVARQYRKFLGLSQDNLDESENNTA